MRETREAAPQNRNRTPLAVRGSSMQTFRSLGLFAEAGLLFCGGYLLASAIVSPLNAGTLTVLGGGIFLSLATVLLFYLAWPTYAKSVTRREEPSGTHGKAFANLPGDAVGAHAGTRWLFENEDELPGPM